MDEDIGIDPQCPHCQGPVLNKLTRYGIRPSCEPCGLHSWDGKPLVSQAVHDARQRAHAAFDRIWENAADAYTDDPPTSNRQRKKVQRIIRNRAYLMVSHMTGIPEPECHMSEQQDLEKLATIEAISKTLTATIVRRWWKENDHGN